ncbi:MAG: Sec-independent protein translocase subunit TatA/TatB [Cytophagales bacterium]|jgi:sec-independent protein translocase protein TatA|nr:twin-arginine translocase TatA/TatE family subunit [Flammeovirgaceae bacterium]MDA7854814.1 twin-arginine translocase TatA/TatE family subunit [Cyclobacteriaceae bacterium]OUT93543.1 MAG: twin-arginine translocase TatA/TatE family subunit [Flammeovirgaceae bacterium TMED32]MDA9905717.1 twin-arginine translocase TatA/TatE family subunit [Cyclobacteriaceae bacterium]MDB4291488.1 twin-arginine translocase TatA/TatE family subunit [Cyclobacteriaceae bacterium]|tara:strand:+ start:269 stop:472 length:204 start_codon:yes stop_codon:yes gene_type:complete
MDTVLAFGMPGGWEWIVIGLFLVVFFGAKKIPEIARGLGKGIREFKDATKDIKQEIEQGAQSDEKKP